jgi:ribosomal protein S18 acetylase RimI-like enzyme
MAKPSISSLFDSAVLIRPSDEDDFTWAYDLFRRVNYDLVTELAGEWPEPHQRDFFAAGFQDAPPAIVEIDGIAAGMFCLDSQETRLKLRHLHIDTDFQGRGIGTSVLQLGLGLAHEQQKPFELEALTNNHRAIALYRKFGFEACGAELVHGWVREVPMRHRDTHAYTR